MCLKNLDLCSSHYSQTRVPFFRPCHITLAHLLHFLRHFTLPTTLKNALLCVICAKLCAIFLCSACLCLFIFLNSSLRCSFFVTCILCKLKEEICVSIASFDFRDEPKSLEVLSPPEGCKPGDRVYSEGSNSESTDQKAELKKKLWEKLQVV